MWKTLFGRLRNGVRSDNISDFGPDAQTFDSLPRKQTMGASDRGMTYPLFAQRVEHCQHGAAIRDLIIQEYNVFTSHITDNSLNYDLVVTETLLYTSCDRQIEQACEV